jgi:hypothetical protein
MQLEKVQYTAKAKGAGDFGLHPLCTVIVRKD